MKCICERSDALFNVGNVYNQISIKNGELRMYSDDFMKSPKGYIVVDI